LSHLIHLSDRIEVRCHGDNVLARAQTIRQAITSESGRTFKPEYVQAFLSVSSHDVFWFELAENNLEGLLTDLISDVQMSVSLDALKGVAEFLSLVVDSRSRFTARHSSGVACAAKFLARKMNLSADEIQELEIAGLLHDIGKLAIPVELLEKPGALTPDERALMKSHVYKTYQILSKVHGLASITQIAAMHHERGQGDGYPFGLDANDLSLSQKIMAVADVFTALAEDRPYRAQMAKAKILALLEKEARSQSLDATVCACVANHYDALRACIVEAQQRSEAQLDSFWAHSR
jgi:putative nucleotidyltransferase with HDIG domain